MRVFIFIGLVFVVLFPVFSQSIIRMENDYEPILVGDEALFYCDTTRQMSITDILRLSDVAYHQYPAKGLVTPTYSYKYWVKLTLLSATDMDRFILINNTNNDILNFYELSADGSVISSIPYGDLVHNYHRDYNYENPIYKTRLQAGIPRDIYIEFWTYTVSSRLPIYIHSDETLINEISIHHIKMGTLFGIMMIFIILTLYNYTFSKSSLQLYLMFVVLGTSFYIAIQSGLGLHYLWSSYVYYNSILMDISALIVYVAIIRMLQIFLDLKNIAPKTNKFLTIVMFSFPFLVLLVTIGFYLLPEYIFSPINLFIGTIYLSINIFFFYVIIRCYFLSRKWQTLLFLIANLAYFVAVIIYNLVPFIDIPNYMYDNAYWLIIVYILNLLFVFSYNQHQSEKLYDDSQKELILQKELAVKNIIIGQIQERKRLSRDLHDGVSTVLANLKMRFSGLLSEIPKLEHDPRKISIERDLNDLSRDIRSYSHNLNPTILIERGLKVAINETIYKYEMAQVDVDFSFTTNLENSSKTIIDITIQHALYFCQVEILNNIMKHGADVDTINIELNLYNSEILLSIFDNGTGRFSMDDKPHGHGINNINNRIKILNGNFTILSSDNGVYHIITIPLQFLND